MAKFASAGQSSEARQRMQNTKKPHQVSSTSVILDQSNKPSKHASVLFTKGSLFVTVANILPLLLSLCELPRGATGIAPSIDYSHNMRILKLPKSTQVGELVYRLRGSDGDANGHLQFGVAGIEARALLDVVPVSRAQWNEADVYLKSPLLESQYNVTIYVTDGNKTTQVDSTIIVTDDERHQEHQDEGGPLQADSIPVASEQQTLNGSSPAFVSVLDSTGNSSGRWTTNHHLHQRLQHQQLSPFIRPRHVYNVPEDTKPGESIATINVLESEKSDLPVRFELRGQGAERFQIKYVFGPRGQSKGELLLVQPLDYEKQNLYSLKVLALNAWTNLQYDTRNVASLDVVITVGDVQDSAPVFRRLPHSVRLTNTMQAGDLVARLEAEDGDYADQRPINYALDAASPLASFFDIDKHTGEVRLKRPVNELALYGPPAWWTLPDWSTLTVYAQEAPDTTSYEHLWPPMLARAELPLQLVDLANEAPRFVGGWQTNEAPSRLSQRVLHGYLRAVEASNKDQELRQQLHNPTSHFQVQWYTNNTNHKFQHQETTANELNLVNGRPLAIDLGLGANGTFEVYLEGPDAHLFELEPKYSVTRQTAFNLYVQKEALKSLVDRRAESGSSDRTVELSLVAKDFGLPERMSSRVKLSIELLDDGSNAKPPQFEQDIYLFPVYENAQLGQVVGSIKARLEEPEKQPTKPQRVRYTSLTGLDSQLFRLDAESGLITLEGQLDREKQGHYLLLAEARDQTSGTSNYSKIIVNVMDVNDNAPIFTQQHYDAVLLPDGSFHQPLVVSAVDIDEPGSVNSQVAYEIIAGNQNEQFMIDSLSGVIYANPNNKQPGGISLGNLPSILSEPIVPFTLAPPPQAGKIGGGSSSSSSYTSTSATESSHEVEEETSRPTGRPTTTQSIPMRLKNWLGLSSSSPDSTTPASGRGRYEENAPMTTTTSNPPAATRTGRLLAQEEPSALEMLVNMESSPGAGNRFAATSGGQQTRNLLPQTPFNPMKLPPLTSLIVRAHDFGIPLRSSTCKVNIYNQAVQSRLISVILNGTSEQLDQRRDAIERAFGAITGSRASIESLDALSESSSLCVARMRLAMPQSSIVDLTDLSSLMNAIDYKPSTQHLLDQQQQQQFRHPTGSTATTITHYIAAGDRLYPASITPHQQQQQFHSASSNITSTSVNGGLLHPTLYTDINSFALDSNNALERRLLIYIIIVGVCILALLVIWMIYSCSREDQVKLIDNKSLEEGQHQRYRSARQQEVSATEAKKTTTSTEATTKKDANKTHPKTTGSGEQLTSSNSAIGNNLAKQHVKSTDGSPPSLQPMNLSRPEQYSMYNGQVWFGPVPVPTVGFPAIGPGSMTTGRHHRQDFGASERRASSAPSGNSLDSALHLAIGGRNSALHRNAPRPANGQFFPNTVGYMENLASINNSADLRPFSPGSSQSNLLNRRQRRRKVAPLNDVDEQADRNRQHRTGQGHTNEAFEMDESGNMTATSGEQMQTKGKQAKRTSKGQASRTTTTTTDKSRSRLGSATLSESSTCSSATRTADNDEEVFLDSDQELLGFDSTGTPIIATHTRRASLGQQQVSPAKKAPVGGISSLGDNKQPDKTEQANVDAVQTKQNNQQVRGQEQSDSKSDTKTGGHQNDEQSEKKQTTQAATIDAKQEETQATKEQHAQGAKSSQQTQVKVTTDKGGSALDGVKRQQAAGDLMGELNEHLVRRQKTLKRQSADNDTFEGPSELSPGKQTEPRADEGKPSDQRADKTAVATSATEQTKRLASQESSLSLRSDQMKLPQVVGLNEMKNSDLLEKQSIFAMTYSGIATDKLPS